MSEKIQEEPIDFATIMFEREKELEIQFNEKYLNMKNTIIHQNEVQNKVDKLYSKLAHRFLAILMTKGVEVPNFTNNPDEETTIALNQLVDKYANMAADFDIVLNAIHNNPTLYSEWERFMMILRMAE